MANPFNLTDKEKITADTYLNAEKKIPKYKAVQAGYPNVTYESARTMVGEIFAKPRVQAYLADADKEAQLTIVEHMQQREDKRLSFDAARDIQDRVHGKAVQKVEQNTNGISLIIDLTSSLENDEKALPEVSTIDNAIDIV